MRQFIKAAGKNSNHAIDPQTHAEGGFNSKQVTQTHRRTPYPKLLLNRPYRILLDQLIRMEPFDLRHLQQDETKNLN